MENSNVNQNDEEERITDSEEASDSSMNQSEETQPLLGVLGSPTSTRTTFISFLFRSWKIILNLVIHLLIASLTLTYWYWSLAYGPIGLFYWHPGLMITGLTFVFESILVFARHNALTDTIVQFSYRQKVQLHWILHTIGLFCITAGFIIIFTEKMNQERGHFRSYHSRAGLATVIFACLTYSAGLTARFFNNILHPILRLQTKVLHITLATSTVILGTATVLLAFETSWFEHYYSKSVLKYPIYFLLPILVALILSHPALSIIKRIERILNSTSR